MADLGISPYDKFVKTTKSCFEIKEPIKNGSVIGAVNFCAFHPTAPILSCGLSDGTVVTIEGSSCSDPFSVWSLVRNQQRSDVNSPMTGLEWNMDGSQLAVGFLNGTLNFLARVGDALHEVKHCKVDQIWALTWNRFSSSRLATQSGLIVLIWDTDLPKPNVIQSVSFHVNVIRDIIWLSNVRFATCSDDGSIQLCEIGKDLPIRTFDYSDGVISISWNPGAKLLASCSRNRFLKIWSTESDEPFRNWNREDVITGQSQCIAWVPGTESTVACGLQDGTILIWNVLTNVHELLLGHSCLVWDVSFSSDGKFLASIDQQGVFIIRSTKDWKIVFECSSPFRASKRCLLWQPMGYKVAIANPSHEVQVIEFQLNGVNANE